MKDKRLRPGFELGSPCPFPKMLIVTPYSIVKSYKSVPTSFAEDPKILLFFCFDGYSITIWSNSHDWIKSEDLDHRCLKTLPLELNLFTSRHAFKITDLNSCVSIWVTFPVNLSHILHLEKYRISTLRGCSRLFFI